MLRTRIASSLHAVTLLAACGVEGSHETGQATTSAATQLASGDTSGAITTSGTTDAPTTSSGTSGIDPTCDFICDDTGTDTDSTFACDVFTQDCDEGEKCAPWAAGGGNQLNAVKCVPVLGDGAPGAPCMTIGDGLSGLDDCQKGAICSHNADMMTGTCTELCHGSPRTPLCAEGSACLLNSDGVVQLCFVDCDPLIQDCPNANVCIPLYGAFRCVPDASGPDGGAAYSPCDFANDCDPGNFCNEPTLAPTHCDVNATGCCFPFCDLDKPQSCSAASTCCRPYYEEGTAPPMKENIGACFEDPMCP